jgi:DNA repair photolyase
MLGQMYTPKGYALETTQAVLECKDVRAVNVAKGCTNGCTYCYGPEFMHMKRENWCKVSYPSERVAKLIAAQLTKEPAPEGVFASYLTDPLLNEQNISNTSELLFELQRKAPRTRTAVLSKTARLHFLTHAFHKLRCGATIVSLDLNFQQQYEPFTASAARRSLDLWNAKHDYEAYTFLSMEPYPCKAIHEQKLLDVLEDNAFVDFIIFGKWNYDARASTPEAKLEYKEYVDIFRDFCKSHNIRSHVKSETLKFIGETL